ncbi:MAG: CinA family protein [Gammaproteobacteria bacterium]
MPSKTSTDRLAERLIKMGLTLVVAESCTGGMLAEQCTSISGGSAWFECGFVTYSNASKIRLLGVDANVIDEHGAVSSQVAELMALGALEHSDAEISAAITGIAGPGGGSESKPVGTVYIATARKGQVASSKLHTFRGDRQSIRNQSTQSAIEQLLERVSGKG